LQGHTLPDGRGQNGGAAAKSFKKIAQKNGALAYLAGQSCVTEHQPSTRTSAALVHVQKHQI
jgi:hypothetical protein